MGPIPECRRPVVVNLEEGLHLRPLTLIVHRAQAFQSEVRVRGNGRSVDAKSMFDLMTLGAGCGVSLTLEAYGQDACAAVDSLAALFESNFAEPAEGLPANGTACNPRSEPNIATNPATNSDHDKNSETNSNGKDW